MARIAAMPAGAAMATCRHGEVEAETNREADDDERGFAHCLGWLQVVVEAEGSSEGDEEQRDQEGSCRDAEPGPVGCPQQRQADGEAVAVQAGDSLDLLGPDSGIAAVRGEYEPDQQRCRRYHQHQPDVLQHRYDASVGFELSAAATIPALPGDRPERGCRLDQVRAAGHPAGQRRVCRPQGALDRVIGGARGAGTTCVQGVAVAESTVTGRVGAPTVRPVWMPPAAIASMTVSPVVTCPSGV